MVMVNSPALNIANKTRKDWRFNRMYTYVDFMLSRRIPMLLKLSIHQITNILHGIIIVVSSKFVFAYILGVLQNESFYSFQSRASPWFTYIDNCENHGHNDLNNERLNG